MADNVTTFIAAGVSSGQWGRLDSANYFIGTGATLANGADSGLGRLYGINNAGPSYGQPQRAQPEGDDAALGDFLFASNELPSFAVASASFDFAFRAANEGSTVVSLGDFSMAVTQVTDPDYPNIIFLLSRRNKEHPSGAGGYHHILGVQATAAPGGPDSMQTGANASYDQYTITYNKSSQTPWGQTMTVAGFGKSISPIIEFTSEYPLSFHAFTGDNSTASFTLDYLPIEASAGKVRVWEDGTALTYTTDFTVNTSTGALTFEAGSIPGAGAKVVVLYQHNFVASS